MSGARRAVGRCVFGRARVGGRVAVVGDYRLCWNSICSWLARAEGDDAPDGIVRRNADSHPISWNHLDAKAAHPAAELGENLVAGVALHAVETAAMNSHHSALHVNEIVLAQPASNPFLRQTLCHIGREHTNLIVWPLGYRAIVGIRTTTRFEL
jgi:hypothetical protein